MQNTELYGINQSFANTVTVATAAAATLATTNPTVAVIDGAFTTALAAGAGKALSLVDSNGATKAAVPLAVNQACVIVNCIDAAGVMRNVQGAPVALDAVTGQQIQVAPFPKIPDTLVPFSYLTIKAGSASTGFTPGVTNWNATGITTTVKDISVLPARPVWP